MPFPLAAALAVTSAATGYLSTTDMAYDKELVKRSTLKSDSYYQGYIEGMPGAQREVDIVGMQRELNTFGKVMQGVSVGTGIGSMVSPKSIGSKKEGIDELGTVTPEVDLDPGNVIMDDLMYGIKNKAQDFLGAGSGVATSVNPYNLRSWEQMKMQPKQTNPIAGVNQNIGLSNSPNYKPPIVDYNKQFNDFTNSIKRLDPVPFMDKTF